MTPNEKDYMDRYIYQVIRRLPKAQREEVRMELEELISDMYADKLVMISNILCGVIQIVLSAIVLKVLPIWNPNFVLEIEQALGANADSSANFFTYWNADMVSNGLLAFIVVITLFEIGVTIYKTLRYGVSVKNGINSNT